MTVREIIERMREAGAKFPDGEDGVMVLMNRAELVDLIEMLCAEAWDDGYEDGRGVEEEY